MATFWVKCSASVLTLAPNSPNFGSVNRFTRGFQRLVEKLSGQNQTAFFLSFFKIRFAVTLHFVKLDLKWKWPFSTSFPSAKEFRNQKLEFSIATHLPSSWKIWWKLAWWSWRYDEQKKKKKKEKKKDSHKSRALSNATEWLTNKQEKSVSSLKGNKKFTVEGIYRRF